MRFVWLIPLPKFNLNNSRRFCTGCKWTWQLINNILLPLKLGGKLYELVYESKATKKKKKNLHFIQKPQSLGTWKMKMKDEQSVSDILYILITCIL